MNTWFKLSAASLFPTIAAMILVGCSFYTPPVPFNNPLDPNRDTSLEITYRTITVDGDTSDWGDVLPARADPQGDIDNPDSSVSAMDISAVFLARDEAYLYWRIDVWDGPVSDVITYDINIWQGIDVQTDTINSGYGGGGSYANVDHFDSTGQWLSSDPILEAVVAAGSSIEGRLPLSVFAGFQNPATNFNTNYYNSTTGQNAHDNSDDVPLSW